MTTPADETAAATAEPLPPVTLPAGMRGNRDFKVVLIGQTVSAFGDAVSFTAMPLLVLFLTGSGALMGIIGALQVVPDLLLGLPAGALADRWDRRKMMMWADAGRAFLTATIPISFWLGLPTMVIILIVAVPINVLRVLWAAGFTSVVPNLVGRENLARANSYFEAAFSGGFIIGPALAGILAATIGPAPTLAIDAATFVISALSLSLVRRPLRAERSGEPARILSDVKEGIRFVWRHVMLRMVITYWGVTTIATAALLPALSYYITIDRGLGPEIFGFVGSVWSIGYLIGSLFTGRLGRERVGQRMLLAGVVIGTLLIAITLTAAASVYLAAAFLIGAALSIVLVSYMTVRASLTPDEMMGRVGGTARTITVGLQPLGLLAGGVLIEAANGGAAIAAMGIFLIAGSLLFAFSRSFREAGH